MKLLTHNFLTSKILKNVVTGFPLKIEAEEVKTVETDFNADYIVRMVSKCDWDALCQAASMLDTGEEPLPKTLGADFEKDEGLLKRIHHIMMEVEVVTGNLVCPETGRKFPIKNGIPNMLLNEDEV